MATTNLIVDFLVIGITSFVWIAPILVYVMGMQWLSVLANLALGQVPIILMAAYVIGIPVSRVADDVTGWWNRRVRDKVFDSTGGPRYHQRLNRIVGRSESATDYLSYRRSIVRVSRASGVNLAAGAVLWMALDWLRPGGVAWPWNYGIPLTCAVLSGVMMRAWHVVLKGYFLSVKDIHAQLPKGAAPRSPSRCTPGPLARS